MGEVERLHSNVAKDAAAMTAMGVLVNAKALRLDVLGEASDCSTQNPVLKYVIIISCYTCCVVRKRAPDLQAQGIRLSFCISLSGCSQLLPATSCICPAHTAVAYLLQSSICVPHQVC